jgi:hypothetical protein
MAVLFLAAIGIPLIFMLVQVKVGDIQTINRPTTVYETYQPGLLGKKVCTLPIDQEVTILDIITSNDLPGAKREMVTEIKAFMVESQNCSGWIFPGNFK